MPKYNIMIIPTFHHDIAYLKPEKDYHEMATAIMNKAILLMEKSAEYTFTVEQAYFFYIYWDEHPEQREKMKKFVKNGQLHFAPGLWTVPDMCMPSGESIYMQATYGKRFLKKSVDVDGNDITVAYIADCWGHHAQLPQILSQCGYKYYVFSRCMEQNFNKENFVWRGLDKSTINGHWMSTGYAGIDFRDSEDDSVNAEELHWESATKKGILSLYNRNKVYCSDDTQIMPAGGDMKTPAAATLPIIDSLQKDDDFSSINFSSFSEALKKIDYDKKEIYDGEFISSMKGSFSTNIEIKQWNNKLEQGLYGLEVLSVMKNIKVDLSDEWKVALKNQFHDIICGTLCDAALQQAMAEYEMCGKNLENKRKKLSEFGDRALFNPLPFAVKGVDVKKSLFISADGLSYAKTKTFDSSEQELPFTFTNDYYQAEFDNNGFIISLIEKISGQQLVGDTGIPFGSLQLQADNGDNWVEFEYPYEDKVNQYSVNVPDPYDRSSLTRHRNVFLSSVGVLKATAFKLGEESVQITQSGMLKFWIIKLPFTTTITMYKSSPRIDYHTEFDCNNRHLRLRVAFPANVKHGVVRHQIPFGIVERGEGTQPASMFMDYQNSDAGVCLINKGIPTNNTEDGIMMLTLFRSVAMEYKCQSELSFNLGKHICSDYAILPHSINSDRKLWENALSFNCPLIETTCEALSDISVENALISALRYDGNDVFIRIYNADDVTTETTINVPECYSNYILTDGCMNPIGVSQKIFKKINIILSPYKVQGLRLIK